MVGADSADGVCRFGPTADCADSVCVFGPAADCPDAVWATAAPRDSPDSVWRIRRGSTSAPQRSKSRPWVKPSPSILPGLLKLPAARSVGFLQSLLESRGFGRRQIGFAATLAGWDGVVRGNIQGDSRAIFPPAPRPRCHDDGTTTGVAVEEYVGHRITLSLGPCRRAMAVDVDLAFFFGDVLRAAMPTSSVLE